MVIVQEDDVKQAFQSLMRKLVAWQGFEMFVP